MGTRKRIMPSTCVKISAESLPLTAWAERLGTPVQTLLGRIQRGQSAEVACTTPIGRSPANRGQRQPAEPLTLVEMELILRQCSNRGACGVRSRALLVLGWRAGLRCAEVLGLYPRDIDHESRLIRVRHGKGDKSRVVGLDDAAWAVLQRWMEKRASMGFTASQPLFCTHTGAALLPSAVRGTTQRLAAKAGVKKRVHFHALRHTCAFEMANEGVSMHVIQQQLGHSSLSQTDRYIRHLNPQEVVKAMQARKWGDG